MKKSKKKRIHHSNRNKVMCQATKLQLINEYGTTCMLCLNDFGKAITHHHMKPVYAGGKDDYENGSLLCTQCQTRIHYYDYGTEEYARLTNQINEYKVKVRRAS